MGCPDVQTLAGVAVAVATTRRTETVTVLDWQPYALVLLTTAV